MFRILISVITMEEYMLHSFDCPNYKLQWALSTTKCLLLTFQHRRNFFECYAVEENCWCRQYLSALCGTQYTIPGAPRLANSMHLYVYHTNITTSRSIGTLSFIKNKFRHRDSIGTLSYIKNEFWHRNPNVRIYSNEVLHEYQKKKKNVKPDNVMETFNAAKDLLQLSTEAYGTWWRLHTCNCILYIWISMIQPDTEWFSWRIWTFDKGIQYRYISWKLSTLLRTCCNCLLKHYMAAATCALYTNGHQWSKHDTEGFSRRIWTFDKGI